MLENKSDVLSKRPVRWGLLAYAIAVCAVFLFCVMALILGWRPESPRHLPPFGASAAECDAAFGRPTDTGTHMDDKHRWSCFYSVRGWNVMVSFDKQRRAEQFIFAKAQLPMMQAPEMSEMEQATLLEKLRFGRNWSVTETRPEGKEWTRSDERSFAFYFHANRWLILMTPDEVDETIRAEHARD